jgi:hypothetical protein
MGDTYGMASVRSTPIRDASTRDAPMRWPFRETHL